jgi:hypothetical protein
VPPRKARLLVRPSGPFPTCHGRKCGPVPGAADVGCAPSEPYRDVPASSPWWRSRPVTARDGSEGSSAGVMAVYVSAVGAPRDRWPTATRHSQSAAVSIPISTAGYNPPNLAKFLEVSSAYGDLEICINSRLHEPSRPSCRAMETRISHGPTMVKRPRVMMCSVG